MAENKEKPRPREDVERLHGEGSPLPADALETPIDPSVAPDNGRVPGVGSSSGDRVAKPDEEKPDERKAS